MPDQLPDPDPAIQPVPPLTLTECPFCSEEIKAAAIKCKHCHSMLPAKSQSVDANLTGPTLGHSIPARRARTRAKTKKPRNRVLRWRFIFIFLAVIAGFFFYPSYQPSVSFAAPNGFDQEGGGTLIAVLKNFAPEAEVEVSYGDAPAFTLVPSVKDGVVSVSFTAPFQSKPGRTTVVVKQGELSARSRVNLVPPAPAMVFVSPATASMDGGDRVTLSLTNFLPEESVTVFFGESSFVTTPEGTTSSSLLVITSEVPAVSNPGSVVIRVRQVAPNRANREATTSFVYEPRPYTIKELVALIDSVGEARAIQMVRERKVSDEVEVTGTTEITKRVGSWSRSFDVTEDLSDYMGVDITFVASGIKPLGTFETDMDLLGFRITDKPSASVLRNTPIACNRCGGDGVETTVDSFCYTCNGDGRLGEGTIFLKECFDCGGDGHVFWDAKTYTSQCSKCSGSGKMRRPR